MATAAHLDTGTSSRAFKQFAIAFLVLTIYLEVFVSRVANVPARAILDATVLLAAGLIVVEAFLRQRIRVLHIILLAGIAVFTVISMLGALDQPFVPSFLSAIIFSKFLIVFFLAPSVDLYHLRPAMILLAVAHVVGAGANLAFPSFFFNHLPDVAYQIDTSRLMGFSLNANRSAAISTILLLYFSFVERRLALAALFFVMIVLSGSRSLTVIAAMMTGYLLLNSDISLPKRMLGTTIAVVGGAVLTLMMLASDDLAQVIQQTIYGDLRYIRAALLSGGYFLANEFFPIGVGGGLYGSSMSAGSEAYRIVGIGHWATVVDMTGVYDSGIGSILGEYGWLGLIIYAIIVFLALHHAYRVKVPIRCSLFLLFLVLFMSFFRTVASDFFFSFFFLFCYVLIANQYYYVRERKMRRASRSAH